MIPSSRGRRGRILLSRETLWRGITRGSVFLTRWSRARRRMWRSFLNPLLLRRAKFLLASRKTLLVGIRWRVRSARRRRFVVPRVRTRVLIITRMFRNRLPWMTSRRFLNTLTGTRISSGQPAMVVFRTWRVFGCRRGIAKIITRRFMTLLTISPAIIGRIARKAPVLLVSSGRVTWLPWCRTRLFIFGGFPARPAGRSEARYLIVLYIRWGRLPIVPVRRRFRRFTGKVPLPGRRRGRVFNLLAGLLGRRGKRFPSIWRR